MGDRLIMSQKELRRKSILDLVKLGQLTQQAASRRLNLCYRQTKRIYQRYLKEGDAGLMHKSRGKRSSRAFPLELKEAVLSRYQVEYEGFGPTLASEKLAEAGTILHAETLRLWLKGAGLWHPQRQRKAHRSRRARRARFGELLQLDGSIHAWFSGLDEKQCLMNLVDDATGKSFALLARGETTEAAFQLLGWWIKVHGIPLSIYVDLKSLYISPKSLRFCEEALVEPEWLTHFSKACKMLGIEVIKAYSPQAKGRVERSHGVYQDRLVKELTLKGIKTIDAANELLQEGFIDNLNVKFMKAPAAVEDAHIALRAEQDLNDLLCWEYTRVVYNDWVVRFENRFLQIEKSTMLRVSPKQRVTVKRHLHGAISLWAKGQKLSYQVIAQRPTQESKPASTYDAKKRSEIARENKSKTPWGQYKPGWLKKVKDYVGA